MVAYIYNKVYLFKEKKNSMKRSAHYILQVVLMIWIVLLPDRGEAQHIPTPKPDEVLSLIRKVNDYWQANNKPAARAFWDNGACHTRNMAVYQVTHEQQNGHPDKKRANHCCYS